MAEFINVNWLIDEDMMKAKYKLLIHGVGNYTADTMLELFWIVLKHRCQHLLKGEGWRD